MQKTVIISSNERKVSGLKEILTEVPQSLILSALLFEITISNVINVIRFCKLFTFADDLFFQLRFVSTNREDASEKICNDPIPSANLVC